MTKLLSAISQVLRMYPALSAAAVNIAVTAAAYAGLHITGEQLIYVMGAVTALFGMLVHSNVTPVAKLAGPLSLTPSVFKPKAVSE